MAKYRTAMGKTIDMSALAARNEKVRAVGNMSVNARGDTIDATGKVVVPVTKKVGDKYQKTVTNRAANIVKKRQEALRPVVSAPKPEHKVDLTAEELELEDSLDDDLEIEQIKAKDTK
jgi:hypothetical protein